jgi:hypothetical protein
MSDVKQDDSEQGRGLSLEEQARRDFLGKAGRFAAVTPPAITLLLGTSLGSRAIAHSNGSKPKKPKGNNGYGQEKHGAPQDGMNPGSHKGKGKAAGGPGAGKTGKESKPDGTGLR